MSRISCVVFALVLLLPLTVQGQGWTPEQQELWAWEVACWQSDNLETTMACFHEDFVGWGRGSEEPTTKADRRPLFAESLENTEQVSLDLQPIVINIRGNTAILIYQATSVVRDKATGEETRSVERWTDVATMEGGRWYWIADHGTAVEGER